MGTTKTATVAPDLPDTSYPASVLTHLRLHQPTTCTSLLSTLSSLPSALLSPSTVTHPTDFYPPPHPPIPHTSLSRPVSALILSDIDTYHPLLRSAADHAALDPEVSKTQSKPSPYKLLAQHYTDLVSALRKVQSQLGCVVVSSVSAREPFNHSAREGLTTSAREGYSMGYLSPARDAFSRTPGHIGRGVGVAPSSRDEDNLLGGVLTDMRAGWEGAVDARVVVRRRRGMAGGGAGGEGVSEDVEEGGRTGRVVEEGGRTERVVEEGDRMGRSVEGGEIKGRASFEAVVSGRGGRGGRMEFVVDSLGVETE